MLYGSKCWAMKERHVSKIIVAEMRILKWMSSDTRLNKIRNESIRENVRVVLMRIS